jgi:hypothetical protein
MNPMHEVTGAAGTSSADPGAATGPIRPSPSKLVINPSGTGVAAAVRPMSQLSLEPGNATRALGQPSPMGDLDRSIHDQAVAQSDRSRFQERPKSLDPRATARTRSRADLLERHLDCGRNDKAVILFGAIGGPLATAFAERGLALSERLLADIDQAPQSAKELALYSLAQLHEAKGDIPEAVNLYRRVLEMTNDPARRANLGADEIRNLDALHDRLKKFNPSRLLMLSLAAPQAWTPRLEIACLQLAGDISYEKGPLEAAARYYEACASRAAQHPDEFAEELEAARESIKWPRSELDVATYEKAVRAGQDHQTVLHDLRKDGQAVLDDFLLWAASDRRPDYDAATTAKIYDRIIPRLMQRDDLKPAFDAIHARLDGMEPNDPLAAKLSLQLADIFDKWEKYPDVIFLLQRVLSSEQALPHLGRCMKLAAGMLAWYGADADAQRWCDEAATRAHLPDDMTSLADHLDDLLEQLPLSIEYAVRDKDFTPLFDYAEALCSNDRASRITDLYTFLLDSLEDSDVDMREVQSTLENHVRAKMPDDAFTRLVVGIRIALADNQHLYSRFAEAASALLEAFQTDLSREPALARECLDCAARVAHVADEPVRATYLVEAAGLLARKTDAAARSNEEKEDVDALEKDLQEELRPTEIDKVQKRAQAQAAKGPEALFADARKFLNDIIVQHSEEPDGA